jgi:predicted O-methyltransferase YrrM
MTILSDHVARYLASIRPERGPVMAEMEALAERDGVPIVHWETGRLLAALCRALDPLVLEVGTAIGYSTLHMAEQLEQGRVVTLEIDPARADQARDFLGRAGVAERVELVEGDARETIASLSGPFDLLFVDAAKAQYAEYIELAFPKLTDRALLVVDNLLMSGDVALPPGDPTSWGGGRRGGGPRRNTDQHGDGRWLGCVLPVGDGIGIAARSSR